MELLAEIEEKDVIPNAAKREQMKYRLRKAGRAVMFNSENKIAFLFVSKHDYHKLPGGGIEEGEDVMTGLEREVVEETDCTIKVGKPLGIIIEYRDEIDLLQLSYCYLADVVKCGGSPAFTEDECSDGFKLKWVTLSEAIKLIKKDKPQTYDGKFIVKRDLLFLEKAREMRAGQK